MDNYGPAGVWLIWQMQCQWRYKKPPGLQQYSADELKTGTASEQRPRANASHKE
jgi:hypothetical protein